MEPSPYPYLAGLGALELLAVLALSAVVAFALFAACRRSNDGTAALLGVALALVLVAFAPGCASNENNFWIGSPLPSPSPSPIPSPSASPKASDVVGWGQFYYGIEQAPGASAVCPPGLNEQIKHAAPDLFNVPAGCLAALTCSSFSDRDEDDDGKKDPAKDPSRAVTWTSSGPATLTPPNDEPAFNRRLRPTGSGIVSVTCTYVASDQRQFSATKAYQVQG